MQMHFVILSLLNEYDDDDAWTSLNFKLHYRSFRVTHYVIFNVILYSFYELNGGKLRRFSSFHEVIAGIISYVNISFVSHFVN